MSMIELNATARDILLATAKEQEGDLPIGRDIRSRLEEYGYREVKSGNLYPALDKLADENFIEKMADPEDNRAHLYRITDKGIEAVETYQQRVLESIEAIQSSERE